jgi:hypothetical protein
MPLIPGFARPWFCCGLGLMSVLLSHTPCCHTSYIAR